MEDDTLKSPSPSFGVVEAISDRARWSAYGMWGFKYGLTRALPMSEASCVTEDLLDYLMDYSSEETVEEICHTFYINELSPDYYKVRKTCSLSYCKDAATGRSIYIDNKSRKIMASILFRW